MDCHYTWIQNGCIICEEAVGSWIMEMNSLVIKSKRSGWVQYQFYTCSGLLLNFKISPHEKEENLKEIWHFLQKRKEEVSVVCWVTTVQSAWSLWEARDEHRWWTCPWTYRRGDNTPLTDQHVILLFLWGAAANNMRRNNGLFCTWNQQPVGGFICAINILIALCHSSFSFLCRQHGAFICG